MKKSVDVSFVIVTYKSEEYIKKCIQSIKEAAKGLRIEIIIVDNASSDDIVENLHTNFPEVIVIKNTKNEGFARAVNKGVNLATGHYLNILNPDTQLFPDTIKTLMKFLESHPECCLVGGQTIDEMGRTVPSCRSLPHIANVIKYPILLFLKYKGLNKPRRYLLDIWKQRETIDVTKYNGYITGACILIRLDFFKKMGMFDERFFLCAEDADFGLRLKKKGFKAYFVSEALLIHQGGRSVSKNPKSRFYTIDAYLQYINKNFTFIHGLVYKICFFLQIVTLTLMAFLRMQSNEIKILLKGLTLFFHFKIREKPLIIGNH